MGLILVAALAGAGCTPSLNGLPKPIAASDPTPLAKCKVAASQDRPLVTEWPASEKSRLEALIGRGAVVVAYSGCELRVLDACAIKGTYAFQKTTLASDTVEIASEDDLYAKLPLGAVRLEGDLKRAGRLAVRTTVVGQFALSGGSITDVPDAGECASATHVVSGLSVGAFKLLAGGKSSVSGGGGVVGLGAVGASHHEQEMTLTESGDPQACIETSDKPNGNCKSPLQIFLQRIPNRQAAPGTARVAMDEEKAPAGAVRVNFTAANAAQHWSLLTAEGRLVCDLPCSRWVGSGSGYKLQLDAEKQEDISVVSVPSELGYSAGRTVSGVLVEPRTGRGGGAALVISGVVLGPASLAVGAAGLGLKLNPDASNHSTGRTLFAVGLVGLGVSAVVILAGALVWARSRERGLQLSLEERTASNPRFLAGPGFLEAVSGARHVLLTPGGFSGTF